MTEYKFNFKKTVWGYATVIAESMEEARKKLEEGDIDDEFDNQSYYEYDFDKVEVDGK